MAKNKKNYYRRITESLPQPSELTKHLAGFTAVFLAVGSALLAFYLFFLYLQLIEINDRKLQAKDSLEYWESVVRLHPNFTDGYFHAGYYSYVLGDKVKASEYLDRALTLDPGFEKARDLEKVIRK